MVKKYLMTGCQGEVRNIRGGVNLTEQFFEKFTGKPPFLTLDKLGFPTPKKAIDKLSFARKNNC